jgi:hypothetical protein
MTTNLFTALPHDLQEVVWKKYFTTFVLNDISQKAWKKYFTKFVLREINNNCGEVFEIPIYERWELNDFSVQLVHNGMVDTSISGQCEVAEDYKSISDEVINLGFCDYCWNYTVDIAQCDECYDRSNQLFACNSCIDRAKYHRVIYDDDTAVYCDKCYRIFIHDSDYDNDEESD